MFRRSEVRQQHRHLVKRSAADGLVVTTAGQVITNLLLVDPEQAVKGYDVSVTDEWQAVIARVQSLTVRSYLYEKPAQHIDAALHSCLQYASYNKTTLLSSSISQEESQ